MQEAFLYTGQETAAIPDGVTRVRVDPSVTRIPPQTFAGLEKLEEVELCEGLEEIGESAFSYCLSLRRIKIPSSVARIPNNAFYYCDKLEEVELCEGLLEIGDRAFFACGSLRRIGIPNTVRAIGASAFSNAALSSIDLPDGLQSIGNYTFFSTRLQHVRIPPLVTEIPEQSFVSSGCYHHFFSVELPKGINRIDDFAFDKCRSLRNIAIPSNAVIEDNAFGNVKDLEKLFVSTSRIKRELQHRFDRLPIHRMVYYQSYHTAEAALENLNSAIDPRSGLCRKLRSRLNPTGNQQDCLGMTPLHILACSSTQNLALYQLIVDKYPENLITEDKWGALPILYALWGDSPSEIIQFLIESHKSQYPARELSWVKMMQILSIGSPLKTVKMLLDMQRNSFPDQSIAWDEELVDILENMEETGITDITEETYRFLLHYSISERLNSIGVKQWRDIIENKIECCLADNRDSTDRDSIYSSLLDYEMKYGELKEATSMVELVLWKKKINESNLDRHRRVRSNRKKKTKIDESGFRQDCRISCGAETVIGNVLPFLLLASV